MEQPIDSIPIQAIRKHRGRCHTVGGRECEYYCMVRSESICLLDRLSLKGYSSSMRCNNIYGADYEGRP